MGTCKICQFWMKNENPNSEGCDNPQTPGCGSCECPKFVYSAGGDNGKWIPTPLDGLGYEDYEQYAASFETGPDFGCIHFDKCKEE